MGGRRRAARALIALTAATGLVAVGPADAGTVVREKTANLRIARAVRDLLRAEGVHVRMTRAGDRTLHPTERTGPANRARVDAFVSIHNNASRSREPSGTIVFHSIRRDGSKRLGARIRDAFRAAFEPGRRSQLTTRRGCCGDYYYQLRWTRMPAVLVEAAFVSHPDEGRRLAEDGSFRARIAGAIATGVLDYQRTLGAGPPPSPDRGIVVAGAAAPVTDASARALRATRVRLAWTARAPVTRIYRDGELIGSRRARPGARASFLDRWASPGQTFRYQVRSAEPVLDAPGGLWRESAAIDVTATTPAISIVLDPGHGGRDPGAVRTW